MFEGGLLCRGRAILLATILLVGHPLTVFTAESLPAEFQGYWVPATASCASTIGIHVTANALKFQNGEQFLAYPIEPCFSCEGGVRYSGVVVWAIPMKAENLFTAYFNAGERKGIAVVEIVASWLQVQFPLNKVELKHCAN